MAHAHNNTLLAKLGFQDDDKTTEHDLACQYLCQKDVMLHICSAVFNTLRFEEASQEVPIEKGRGKYKTTIGFADVLWGPLVEGCGFEDCVIVEVKTKPTSASDVLRQINLYRSHAYTHAGQDQPFVVAVTFMPDAGFGETIKDAGGVVIHLGAGFRDWIRDRPKGKAQILSF